MENSYYRWQRAVVENERIDFCHFNRSSNQKVWQNQVNTCERDGHFVNLAQFHYEPGNMEFPSVVLTLIFSFLEIEDLVRAARVCKDWWKVISRGVYLKEAEPYELDLSRSEDAYRFVPLKMFALLTHLNISSTGVSNWHFEQLSRTAENLEFLDISNCSSLEQSSIFQAKKAFSRLEYMDISGNQGNFTILAVACLCSCESLQMIIAHGFTFTVEELHCYFFQKHLSQFQVESCNWN